MSPEEVKKVRRKFFCNNCQRLTNHILKGEHVDSTVIDEENGFWEELIYRLWICAGCESGTMERAWTADGYYDRNGDQMYESEFFPPRDFGNLTPKKFRSIPKPLQTIYSECVQSFNYGLHLSCAIGLRALMEGICVDKERPGKNLLEKIANLNAILPQNIVDHLHGFRFLGNVAAHELETVDKGTLQIAIEVAEDLLNILYDLEYKSRKLPKK